MKKLYDNIEDQSEDLFSKAKINYSVSKEEAWETMMQKLDSDSVSAKKEVKVVQLNFSKLAIAASITLLIGVGAFLRFYETTVTVEAGNQMICLLPDGSKIELTASSSLNYHPFWWYIDREVDFEGEAFFEVEKGSNFKVNSNLGTTEVLGTSFNISTRNNDYQVYCATGKVRVKNKQGSKKVVLTPKMFTSLKQQLQIQENIDLKEAVAWKIGEFNFKNAILKDVAVVLEREYGVNITLDSGIQELMYSGNFKRPKKVQKALNLICKSFGCSFEEQQANSFIIYK